MAKLPKAPKFQNLPTLEGLAARRGQTVASLLEEWGVKDAATLTDRLKREGLAPVQDAERILPRPAYKDSVVLLPNPKSFDKEIMKDAVERAKKVLKETEATEQKSESKKPAKAKLTSDAPASDVDRAPSKPAVVVPEEAGEPSSKA